MKISVGEGDAVYRPRRGRWDCTPRAKSDIYDCLVNVVVDLMRA